MKSIKILLLIYFCSLTSILYSQEHLKFKGIPVDGSASLFAQKLEKIGFKIVESKDNIITLKGEFINRQCEIFVIGSKKNNIIWKVMVYLPEETSWYRIKNDYFDVKKQYQIKYGEGRSYEFFSKPYYEGDGYEMQALDVEKCTYSTFFETELGIISVEISKYKQIAIIYEDKINVVLKNKEAESIIDNDI